MTIDELPLPNYTQVPNFIIDDGWMAKLSFAEYKVLNLILRYTTGFHRRQASISYSHFQEKCSVSKKWVIRCIEKLESYGWIKVIRGDRKNSNLYELKMPSHETDIKPEAKESYEHKNKKVVNSVHHPSELSTPPLVYSVHPIKKDTNKQRERKHICPAGPDASSSKDEMGHEVFKPVIKGKLKKQYEQLDSQQRQAFHLLINVPSPQQNAGQRMNPVVAIKAACNIA